jgi:CHASE3 domain sensor protein
MGLLSSLFGDNSSSSSSSTTTNNYDQRVASDNGAIAIGPQASYHNELSEQAVEVIAKAMEIAVGGIALAADQGKQSAQSVNNALDTVASQVQRNNEAVQPSAAAFLPYAVIIGIVVIFMSMKKKG